MQAQESALNEPSGGEPFRLEANHVNTMFLHWKAPKRQNSDLYRD